MLRRLVYGRMLSVLNQMPPSIQADLGLTTREARERRAHEVAYGE